MPTRFGRYELVRKLGQGGMAEVYLAVHRGPGGYEKRLVIKRVLPKLAADARFLRLFFDEAKLHVQLAHGNLVPIFDFGRVGNDYFLALEFVEGSDLSALINASITAPLSPACIAFIGQELCRALAYVHRHDLVHRDITPRNVLISIDGEIKLADFGVAQSSEAEAGAVRGTVAYMSPEQARGERVDARSDLYSLGILIAELATARRIRRIGEDVEAALEAIASTGRVVIEGPFAELVMRATELDPAARYSDAGEMMAALESIERGLASSRGREVEALAERVRGLMVVAEAAEVGGQPAEGPATYFRDRATQASIVDEILAPPGSEPSAAAPAAPTPPRPKRAGLRATVAGTASAAAVALVALWLRSPGRAPGAATIEPGAPRATGSIEAQHPSASALDLGLPLPSEPGPVAEPGHGAEARPSSVSGRVAEPARAVAPTARMPSPHLRGEHAQLSPRQEGSVTLRCFPWCVVEVDGQRRGEDGPTHTLALPVGPHRIVAKRLEDREERAVEVSPGSRQAIDLRFE